MVNHILAQSDTTRNIKPAVWGEYEIAPCYQAGRCWTAVWLTSDGPVLGGVRWDRLTGEYVETTLDADGAYVPAPEDWDRHIIRELNTEARGQMDTVNPPRQAA